MAYLTEPQLVLLAGELEVAADENQDASGEGRRGLAVDCADGVPALLEGQLRQLPADLLGPCDGVALEGEHGGLAVERGQRGAVEVERAVVVIHEGPRHDVALALASVAVALAVHFLPASVGAELLMPGGGALVLGPGGHLARAGICRRAAAVLRVALLQYGVVRLYNRKNKLFPFALA